MSMAIGIGLIGLVALMLFWKLALGGLDKAADAAIEAGDVGEVVSTIARRPVETRPTAFNHVIRRLWDAYERNLATVLVRELAEQHHETQIAQYWLKQVLTAEPAIARQVMSKEFVETYFQPEVAAKCGPVG